MNSVRRTIAWLYGIAVATTLLLMLLHYSQIYPAQPQALVIPLIFPAACTVLYEAAIGLVDAAIWLCMKMQARERRINRPRPLGPARPHNRKRK